MAAGGIEGILIGAAIAIASTVGVRLWQYERERWTGRVDWFCDALDAAAELGVEYWIEVGREDQGDTDRKREVQLIGSQIKLDGILETFVEKLSDADAKEARSLLEQFRDALTGGDFQSLSVIADPERARSVQLAASELFLHLRNAVDARLVLFPRRFPVDNGNF